MRRARFRQFTCFACLSCVWLWMPAFAVSPAFTVSPISPAGSIQQLPRALTTDPPPDKLYPAAMDTMRIPSHGGNLNALMYVASGAGPHPVVILLNGFPGNEKNLDLAQAIRRDGWNVLIFSYRGLGGSSGSFSLVHSTEDTATVLAFLRDREYAAALRSDPGRIVLIGHSTGGYVAAYAGAHDASVMAVATISPAHLLALGSFDHCVSKLASRPVLLVTSDDGLAPQAQAFADTLERDGETRLTKKHFSTDHSYSADRIGLTIAVLNWLETLPGKP